MAKKEASEVLTVGGREVQITHPDKLYFSEKVQITKLDLVTLLPLGRARRADRNSDRPIVLKRFVNGAEKPSLLSEARPGATASLVALRRVVVSVRPNSGRNCGRRCGRAWHGSSISVALNCIPHPVRSGDLDHPDEFRVDLDPGPRRPLGGRAPVALRSQSVPAKRLVCAAGPRPAAHAGCT